MSEMVLLLVLSFSIDFSCISHSRFDMQHCCSLIFLSPYFEVASTNKIVYFVAEISSRVLCVSNISDSNMSFGEHGGVNDRRKILEGCCCTVGRAGGLWSSKIMLKHLTNPGKHTI